MRPWKARRPSRKTRIPPPALPEPLGLSPASGGGTAMLPADHQVRSPSTAVSKPSPPSLTASLSESASLSEPQMCAYRSGDAVEALGEPRIEVQAEGTAGEGGDGAFVQRYGVILKAGEIVRGQPHHGRPKDALVFVLGEPQVEGADNLRVDLDGAAIFDVADSNRGGRQPAELVLEHPQAGTVGVHAETPGEGSH